MLDNKHKAKLICVSSHYKKVINLPDVLNRIGAAKQGKAQILPVFLG
jgi:hypothetical protein